MIELAVNVLNDCIFHVIIEIFDNIGFFWYNRLIFKLILLVIKNFMNIREGKYVKDFRFLGR